MNNEYLTTETIRAAVESLKNASVKPATIGQYPDYVNFSNMIDLFVAYPCYCCGQEASWHGGIMLNGVSHSLCDGCHFRHTVMKAAGREEEFWASGSPKPNALDNLTTELSYRMAKSLDAMITATAKEKNGL